MLVKPCDKCGVVVSESDLRESNHVKMIGPHKRPIMDAGGIKKAGDWEHMNCGGRIVAIAD